MKSTCIIEPEDGRSVFISIDINDDFAVLSYTGEEVEESIELHPDDARDEFLSCIEEEFKLNGFNS